MLLNCFTILSIVLKTNQSTTINKIDLREVLAQASDNEVVELFQPTLRLSHRIALQEAMVQEVKSPCETKYKPSESEYNRAGSENGSVYLDSEIEPIKRPRV